MITIEVIREDFDNSENIRAQAHQITTLATCKDGPELTAHGHAAEFISQIPAMGYFLGWDGEVYPKIKTARKEKHNE